jgi:DNA modification methylase
VDIDLLIPHPRNVRQGDVGAICESLKAHGQYRAIVFQKSTNRIIAGNHTWQAAKKLGWTEIAVAYVGDDDTTAQAYALADNRTAELGSYDEEALKDLIEKVAAVDPELVRISGWSDDAVQDLLDKIESGIPKKLNEDIIPEVPEIPIAKPGDIWNLGSHRLICGDSTDPTVYENLLGNDVKVDIVWTDPPWNVNYGAVDSDNEQGYKVRTILNDHMSDDNWNEFVGSFTKNLYKFSKAGAGIYMVMSAQEWPTVDRNLRESGFHWSSTIIWAKDQLVLSRKDYHTQYEPIWYGWNESGARLFPVLDRKQSDVWNIDRPHRSELHPTMKPIELIVRALENSSGPRDLVLDAFAGSGSTLIACEQTGRAARAIELDPKYCDVIVKRWENLTGKKAVLINA